MPVSEDLRYQIARQVRPEVMAGLLQAAALYKQAQALVQLYSRFVPGLQTCHTCKGEGTVRSPSNDPQIFRYDPCMDCRGLDKADVLQLLEMPELVKLV